MINPFRHESPPTDWIKVHLVKPVRRNSNLIALSLSIGLMCAWILVSNAGLEMFNLALLALVLFFLVFLFVLVVPAMWLQDPVNGRDCD
jgi:hypothetical protein